jgi:DNA-binding transcriptional MerR regulator
MIQKTTKRRSLKVIGGFGETNERRRRLSFSIGTLAVLAGISRRQIMYWTKLGMISPNLHLADTSSDRSRWKYSEEEAAKLLIFADMKQRGFSLTQVQTLASVLSKSSKPIKDVKKYILTDGVRVFFADTDREAIQLQKHDRPMLLIDMMEPFDKLSRGSAANVR